MSANPIPAPGDDPVVQPLPVPVLEVQAVCAEHSIPCGKPESLELFVRGLHGDKHLAMEFWSLVARSTARHPSAGPGLLLAAIVQGVTDRSLEEIRASGSASELALRELGDMLAGEDVRPRQVQSAPTLDPTQHSTGRSRSDVAEQRRLVLHTETPFAAAMDRNLREREADRRAETAKAPAAVPLAAYAEEEADGVSGWRVLAGVVLLLAFAAGGALLYHGNWERLGASGRSGQGTGAASGDHAGVQAGTAINVDQENSPSAGATRPQAAVEPENPKRSQPVVTREAQPAAPGAEPGSAREPHAEAQIVVPEALMKQNLDSSRVPIFPQGATGTVVIEAIVTARGTVEPVRVVSGDPALARAAMAAVAAWRYRPYLQDGVPVDVSTTITIDAAGNE